MISGDYQKVSLILILSGLYKNAYKRTFGWDRSGSYMYTLPFMDSGDVQMMSI